MDNLIKNGWNLRFEKYPGCVWIFAVTDDAALGKFVGRFKHYQPVTSARAFAKFLVANFTPAEFFHMRDALSLAPLTILKTKGYVSPAERRRDALAARYAADAADLCASIGVR